MTVAIWSPGRRRAERRSSSSGSPKCMKRPPLHVPTAVGVRSGKPDPRGIRARHHAMADDTRVTRARRGLIVLPLICACAVLATRADATTAPSDPYFAQQWGTQELGAPGVWDASTGAGVTVAVVDTGVDATHPD